MTDPYRTPPDERTVIQLIERAIERLAQLQGFERRIEDGHHALEQRVEAWIRGIDAWNYTTAHLQAQVKVREDLDAALARIEALELLIREKQ